MQKYLYTIRQAVKNIKLHHTLLSTTSFLKVMRLLLLLSAFNWPTKFSSRLKLGCVNQSFILTAIIQVNLG